MKKFFTTGSLALLQVAIVGNLQTLPANAQYGFSLPLLYLIAIITFYVPCMVMVSKLAVQYPITGGIYIWTERAFGRKAGFYTAALLWLSNLLWYPSLFALIAANLAYLVDIQLAQSKIFVLSFGVIIFWLITLCNCLGIQFSTRLSVICSVLGIILPMLLLSLLGLKWWLTGAALAINTTDTPWLPSLTNFNNLGYLIAVVISLFGLELSAVHAGDVPFPKKDYPKSLMISSIILLVLMISAELAIAIIVPAQQLSLVTGVLDALKLFFEQLQLQHWLTLVLILVFLGNLGSAAAWMLGSTRSMAVACQHNHVWSFLQKTSRREAPIGVLLFEAIIFTCASSVFLLFPNVTDSFWLLLVLASQLSLIYYVLLFTTAIALGTNLILMLLAMLTATAAFFVGFIPSGDLTASQKELFHWILFIGLFVSLILPIIFLKLKSKAYP